MLATLEDRTVAGSTTAAGGLDKAGTVHFSGGRQDSKLA